MALIYRPVVDDIKKQIESGNIVILLGARQVGKTSILMILIEEFKKVKPVNSIFYFDLEKGENLELLSDYRNLINYLTLQGADLKRVNYLFIDEFHYLPTPNKILKILHDSHPDLRIIATGSSSLEITSKIKESLAGRKRVFTIYALNFEEYLRFKTSPLIDILLRAKQNKIQLTQPILNEILSEWEEFCVFGGYPKVTLTQEKEEKIKEIEEIYNSYVQKDIKAFLKLENVLAYNKLVKILATQIGSLVNIHQLVPLIGVARQTIERYLFVLENTYVMKLLAPFFTNKQKEITKMAKSFFYDTGIRNYALKDFRTLGLRPDCGNLVENGVFSETTKSLSVLQNLHFWRTQAKTEVDFILSHNGKIIPIEVKYRHFDRPKISSSLKAFISQYRPSKGYVLNKDYYGVVSYLEAEIEFLPVFLVGSIISENFNI
jgi:predicted AAA+ superfamily ATPase